MLSFKLYFKITVAGGMLFCMLADQEKNCSTSLLVFLDFMLCCQLLRLLATSFL